MFYLIWDMDDRYFAGLGHGYPDYTRFGTKFLPVSSLLK